MIADGNRAQLGVLRDGMLADILVVGSDPREDIQTFGMSGS